MSSFYARANVKWGDEYGVITMPDTFVPSFFIDRNGFVRYPGNR